MIVINAAHLHFTQVGHVEGSVVAAVGGSVVAVQDNALKTETETAQLLTPSVTRVCPSCPYWCLQDKWDTKLYRWHTGTQGFHKA